jgi:hypothetical protein
MDKLTDEVVSKVFVYTLAAATLNLAPSLKHSPVAEGSGEGFSVKEQLRRGE